jgi:spore maturation protein CgeB
MKSRQIKARLFEVAGMGGCLMTEPAIGLENCFQLGDELTTFNSAEELAQKLTFYLNQPEERDRIARAGQRRVAFEHTYEIRFAALLEAAVQRRRPPNGQEIDMNKFISIAKRHEVGFTLSLLRILLVSPFTLIWGRARGARAARRFLFEVSWRIVGRHTYTAAGWPGRLFYWES